MERSIDYAAKDSFISFHQEQIHCEEMKAGSGNQREVAMQEHKLRLSESSTRISLCCDTTERSTFSMRRNVQLLLMCILLLLCQCCVSTATKLPSVISSAQQHAVHPHPNHFLHVLASSRQDMSLEMDDMDIDSNNRQQRYAYAQPVPVHQPINPLMKQASTGAIGILFVLLIWRSLAAYELADQFNVGITRIIAVTPTVLILLANLAGFVVNMMKPHNFKNTLKVVLAMNVIREFIEMLYNISMLVLNNRRSGLQIIPTEVYIGRFFMNAWWLSLCLTFSKSRWVLAVIPPSPQQQSVPQQQQQAPDGNPTKTYY